MARRLLTDEQMTAIETVLDLLKDDEDVLARAALAGHSTEADIDGIRSAKYRVTDLIYPRPRWLLDFEEHPSAALALEQRPA